MPRKEPVEESCTSAANMQVACGRGRKTNARSLQSVCHFDIGLNSDASTSPPPSPVASGGNALLQGDAVQLVQSAHGIEPDLCIAPRRAIVEKLQSRRGAGCKSRIGRHLSLELRLQLRILCQHLARKLFQHIRLA